MLLIYPVIYIKGGAPPWNGGYLGARLSNEGARVPRVPLQFRPVCFTQSFLFFAFHDNHIIDDITIKAELSLFPLVVTMVIAWWRCRDGTNCTSLATIVVSFTIYLFVCIRAFPRFSGVLRFIFLEALSWFTFTLPNIVTIYTHYTTILSNKK